jgi:hypothetical protein
MRTDRFLHSIQFVYLIIEIIIACIHPNLLFEDYFWTTNQEWYLQAVTYSANDFLTIFMVVRFYSLFRSMIMSTDFFTMRAYRVNKMFGSNLTTMFALRAFYKTYPFYFLMVFAVSVATLSSYVLRIIEGPLWYIMGEAYQSSLNDFRSYENCIWNTFVTMYTVGYGDYYQVTNFGRLICIINSLCGSIMVSLTVITIQNSLSVNIEESKVVEFLDRLNDRFELEKASTKQFRVTFRYLNFKKKYLEGIKNGNLSKHELLKIEQVLKKAVYQRVKLKKKFKNLLQ